MLPLAARHRQRRRLHSSLTVLPHILIFLITLSTPCGCVATYATSTTQVTGSESLEQESPKDLSRRSLLPSKISEVRVLGQTNETILIGWRTPPHVNETADVLTTQYQMHLRNPDNELVSDQSIEVDTRTTKRRTNYMYIFVNLDPGTRYWFQVRACAVAGCGNWSDPPLEAHTASGYLPAPTDVHVRCLLDHERQVNTVSITWTGTSRGRTSITGYNVSVEGYSKYMNERHEVSVDYVRQWYVTPGNTSLQIDGRLLFHTNYTIRICTLNRSTCGPLSAMTTRSMCSTPVTVPAVVAPADRLSLALTDPRDPTCRRVRALFPRVSERNGTIKCYKLVIIRLPDSSPGAPAAANLMQLLPRDPRHVNISTYEKVHADILLSGSPQSNSPPLTSAIAYIPEAFASDRLLTDVVIGDDNFSQCVDEDDSSDQEDYRTARGVLPDDRSAAPYDSDISAESLLLPNSHSKHKQKRMRDGILAPGTNYSAFIEIHVTADNGTILKKRSHYFPVVQTGYSNMQSDQKGTDSIDSLSPFASFLYSMTESPKVLIFGVSSGLLILCLVTFFLCIAKKKSPGSSKNSDTSSEGIQTPAMSQTLKRSSSLIVAQKERQMTGKRDGLIVSPACNHKYQWIGQPILTHSLSHILIERHADADLLFRAEFDALPDSFADRTTIAADLLENVPKNRYPDIKSYDQTRVRLPLVDGILGSDYINADFVEGYRARKLYICAQGPLQETIPDFWRMIYEHKVCVIVMLTEIEEQGKIKCSQYWSDEEGEELLVSDLLSVRLQSKRCFADFVIRSLVLRSHASEDSATGDSEQQERHILQFHFLLWKDFLSPEQPAWLLRFIRRVNEYYCPDKGPLLVHCSAGVGRTGTFVAIDSLLPDIGESDFVNIWECVAHLRSQRNFLVQSLKQYMFVYRAVVEYCQFGETDVELRHLNDHYKQLREQRFAPEYDGLMAEFDRLNAVIEEPKSTCVGSLAINTAKNRFEFVVPYDMNRVILSPHSPEQSSYINASFVQGYDRFLSFIVTQDPLPSTISDFWRMISEQSISKIVMLSDSSPELMNCPVYWPESEHRYDHIIVQAMSQQRDEKNREDCFIKRTFTVTNEKEPVCLFLCYICSAIHPHLPFAIAQNQYDFLYRSLVDYVTSRNLCDMADTQL